MVIFRELEMEGFKKYDLKKNYKFDEGLIGIFGKNESGKSTIGDAISVALFGLSSTTYKKADIVTWGRLNTKLRLDFETDISYRVERNLGSKNRAMLKKNNNGRWEIIANTIKNVDNQIQDILGLDYKSFKNSIFIGQNDLNSLSSLSKIERQTIINRLSRYDELSKAENLIKEDLKEKRIGLQILEKDFEALDKIVNEKKEKYEKLERLNEDYSEKGSLLKEKESALENIRHEIKISIELKKIDDAYGKINDLKDRVDEKVREISRIEEKENDKKEYEEKLKNLEHLNQELEEAVDEIKRIVSNIDEVENRKSEISKLESLINEKVREISRIEEKENDKEEYEEKLKNLEHVDSRLKGVVENIETVLSRIQKNQINKDKTFKDIEGLEKSLKGLETSIEEKDTEIQRIEDREAEIKLLKKKQDKLIHHTPQLKRRIDEISGIISQLASSQRELARINREKSEISHPKDEKQLQTNYDVYETILTLEENSNSVVKEIGKLDKDIELKREQLGDLKDEKGDLAEIENKYESDNSKATIFIGSGIFISLLGVALGFIVNILFLIVFFVGLIPLYKGYKDKNHFKGKLIQIRDKREFFGQLKQLDIQKNEKKAELHSYRQGLEKYKDMDRESLSNAHEAYKNLKNNIEVLKKLDNDKIIVQKRIKDYKDDLYRACEEIPDQYKENISLTDSKLDKKLLSIYQEEDKEKSKCETSIGELMKQITRKTQLIEEIGKLNEKKKETEVNIEGQKTELEEIVKAEESLDLDLDDKFEGLPVHYREQISIDDEELDKKISRIYQAEDKKKSSYLSSIKGLDKEISRKDEVIEDKERLETDKVKVETEITEETQRLKKELEENYSHLPVHYREQISIDDEELDKKISRIYQAEDKEKSKLETSILELNKEISRKPTIVKEKEGLETEKGTYEDRASILKTGLRELTDEEDLEYDPPKHQQLETQEKELGVKISQCERNLGTLQGEIKTLQKDTIDLDDKTEECDGLKERIDELNFEFDVMDIAKNEIANTAKMLREQVMERTRKHVYFLLPKITNNKYRDVKITEDFKIQVYSPEKNEYESINSLSGGAIDQILFSLRLAFTNAILGGRSRSKGFSLFLDEFLGSFDQSRRDETLKMLKGLKDDFRQIFLITHIDGMEGNVDQVIRTPEI